MLHVESLTFEHRRRSLNNWLHHRIDGAEHDCREEHDAQSDGERTQQREHIHRLGGGKRFPDTHRHIEQCAESGYRLSDTCHVAAQRHHLVIEGAEDSVQVVKIYRAKHRCYQYFSEPSP